MRTGSQMDSDQKYAMKIELYKDCINTLTNYGIQNGFQDTFEATYGSDRQIMLLHIAIAYEHQKKGKYQDRDYEIRQAIIIGWSVFFRYVCSGEVDWTDNKNGFDILDILSDLKDLYQFLLSLNGASDEQYIITFLSNDEKKQVNNII